MITSKDRSYYIGASDAKYVVGNWETKTFANWYAVKQGIYSIDFTNDAMMAGTFLEHRILDALNIKGLVKDRQITAGRLRANLDGCTDNAIYEVKTYNNNKAFKVPKDYINQVIVQMYITGIREAYIVAYGLEEADYINYYREIETSRISFYKIEYNEEFINNIFLPRLNYLSVCLDNGVFPKLHEKAG